MYKKNLPKVILITGGAGFIGSQIITKLLLDGCQVRVVDNLSSQIHGHIPTGLDFLKQPGVDFIRGSVTSLDVWRRALENVDSVIHLAAETGTGQSMYEINRYFDVNVQGTANMLQVLQNDKVGTSLRTLIVASSRAVYGEGSYMCPRHGVIFPDQRSAANMSAGVFEFYCPSCKEKLTSSATEECAPFKPMSVYALTKQTQEQAVLMHARNNNLNGFAFRYQNVYGPGQSLKNPYTGILAVFSNLARQSQVIDVYEDGLESRDFVYIDDVVEATIRAVMYREEFVGALNVGSGLAVSVIEVANQINKYFGNRSEVRITGAYRAGDIRHNTASTLRLESVLNFKPMTPFRFGLERFLAWVETQPLEDNYAYQKSLLELKQLGLMKVGKG